MVSKCIRNCVDLFHCCNCLYVLTHVVGCIFSHNNRVSKVCKTSVNPKVFKSQQSLKNKYRNKIFSRKTNRIGRLISNHNPKSLNLPQNGVQTRVQIAQYQVSRLDSVGLLLRVKYFTQCQLIISKNCRSQIHSNISFIILFLGIGQIHG